MELNEAISLDPARALFDRDPTSLVTSFAAGANPKEVAARAGHTSVSFTLDRYGHLLPGSEQRLNDALDALAEEARAPSADGDGPDAGSTDGDQRGPSDPGSGPGSGPAVRDRARPIPRFDRARSAHADERQHGRPRIASP